MVLQTSRVMPHKKEPKPVILPQQDPHHPFAKDNFFADTGFFPGQANAAVVQRKEQEPEQRGGKIKRTRTIPYDVKVDLSQGHEELIAQKVDSLMKQLWKGKGLLSTENISREDVEFDGRTHFKNWLRKSFFGQRGDTRDSVWANEVDGTGIFDDDNVSASLQMTEIEFVSEDDIQKTEGQASASTHKTEQEKGYELGTEYYRVNRNRKETQIDQQANFEASGYNIYTANVKLKIEVTNTSTKSTKTSSVMIYGVTLSTARDLDAQVKLDKKS
jgi:hypothetical protein